MNRRPETKNLDSAALVTLLLICQTAVSRPLLGELIQGPLGIGVTVRN